MTYLEREIESLKEELFQNKCPKDYGMDCIFYKNNCEQCWNQEVEE